MATPRARSAPSRNADSVKKPWNILRQRPALTPVLAFLAFLALTLSWSLGTPLLSAADEPEVVVKAAASVRGEFSGREQVVPFPTAGAQYATPDFVEVTYHLPHSLVDRFAELQGTAAKSEVDT